MGQLATKISERESGKFPNQPIPNPKGQYEVSQPSTSCVPSEHVQVLTTLTYKRQVNDLVEKLNPNQVESEEDVVTLKNRDNSTENKVVTLSPSESKSSNMFEQTFIPRAPFPQRLSQAKA